MIDRYKNCIEKLGETKFRNGNIVHCEKSVFDKWKREEKNTNQKIYKILNIDSPKRKKKPSEMTANDSFDINRINGC